MRAVRTGNNPYCGPAVLSVLTGKTTDECAAVLSYVTGRRDIAEVFLSEIEAALRHMRFTFERRAVDCSMYSFFIQASQEDGFYLLSLPKHIVTIEVKDKKIWFCDNHTKEPINGAVSARLGQQCHAAYKVEPKPDPIFLKEEIKIEVQKYMSSWKVDIYKEKIFKLAEDNSTTRLGSIVADTEADLKAIRDAFLMRF